ncbi:BTAD domain-containing putative transcriptional regulator [Amycolatopsis methanolica]|uniref:SARP transcriptional regulator n=1 Tax=Amycolatopsis methanolica 239 TaxID=1068978 RepID=A0A076N7Q1_AMYME|nr:BTAD domain-containing putative transcriptional regulator [Amycolatopsis methanolica]AIJ26057.1 SARP transcriptional regulator [Amycolatopsis methanolica 239]
MTSPVAVRAATDALDLFDGEPLTGLPGPFLDGHRLRLTECRIALRLGKAGWQLRLGRHGEVIDELSALAGVHPHHEELAALLMRALYAAGRRADALAVFAGLRRRLVDDLGVEPGAEPRRVQQAVLRGDDSALGVTRKRPPRNELPADSGELAGRAEELARLVEPGDPELVTVIAVDGVAGAGKSALALRAAHVLRPGFPDGCLHLDLHGHTEGHEPLRPAHALARLLRAIGVGTGPIGPDVDELAATWRSATASSRLLLVLDDAKSAEQVRPLLPSGAGSTVLVPSRQRLTGLPADRRVSLDVLDAVAAEGLLRRVVGAERVGREPGAARELVRLCGGLPPALRIAGARMQNRPMWTFEYLVGRLADDERRLGELTAEDHRYDECRAALEIALPLAEQCSGRRMRSALRFGFGVAEGMRGHYERCRPWLHEALRISRQAGDRREEARALGGLGTLAMACGDTGEALALLHEAHELGRRLDDPFLCGMTIANLGLTHLRLGRFDEARACLDQAVAFGEEIGRPRAVAMALGSLGKFHLAVGRHADAVGALRRAAGAAEEAGDIALTADCLSMWGAAESGLGNAAAALELQRRAFALVTGRTRPRLELEIRNRLGASLLAVADVSAAREQFEVVLARTSGDHAERARAGAGLVACEAPGR